MRQDAAKRHAQELTGKPCKTRVVKLDPAAPKRCCIYIDGATQTPYHGETWQEAADKLSVRYKHRRKRK